MAAAQTQAAGGASGGNANSTLNRGRYVEHHRERRVERLNLHRKSRHVDGRDPRCNAPTRDSAFRLSG